MVKNKKKVLIVTNPLNVGGFDIVASNLQMHMNHNKFEFVYCVRGEDVGPLESKVIASGARVIHQPSKTLNYIKSFFYLKNLMRCEEIDIVHSHLMFYSGIVMAAAKAAGVPKRVAHSHMTDPCIENRSVLKRFIASIYAAVMRLFFHIFATDEIACSWDSGVYLYGKRSFEKRGILLNNAVDVNRFAFSKEVRRQVRLQLQIQDKLVVGHVGRLNYVKNHKFLLKVFEAVHAICPDSVLLLVGDGEERTALESLRCALGLEDCVYFLGTRMDVEKLLCAMDVFAFPSLHEGFPMTLIEAQATKLSCLVSDNVSECVKINENVQFLSLQSAYDVWAHAAISLAKTDRTNIDTTNLREQFEIHSVAKQLEKIYLSKS